MEHRSEWLTSVRIRRMQKILLLLPGLALGRTQNELIHVLWKKCGGTIAEVTTLLDIMDRIKLLKSLDTGAQRTPAGDKLARLLRSSNEAPLGLYLIRSGFFHDQARLLLESGTINSTGQLICQIRNAQNVAPQLVHLLSSWEGVHTYPEFVASSAVLQEINSIWALIPPPLNTPKWLLERKQVGDRAEMYSLQMERTTLNPTDLIWVSRDTDALGYDIEDRSSSLLRCIEVKGRRDRELTFFLSENEWNKANALGARYEIHFWGGIDLASDPAIEYAALRAAGYPIVFIDPVRSFGTTLKATAVKWRVEMI